MEEVRKKRFGFISIWLVVALLVPLLFYGSILYGALIYITVLVFPESQTEILYGYGIVFGVLIICRIIIVCMDIGKHRNYIRLSVVTFYYLLVIIPILFLTFGILLYFIAIDYAVDRLTKRFFKRLDTLYPTEINSLMTVNEACQILMNTNSCKKIKTLEKECDRISKFNDEYGFVEVCRGCDTKRRILEFEKVYQYDAKQYNTHPQYLLLQNEYEQICSVLSDKEQRREQ